MTVQLHQVNYPVAEVFHRLPAWPASLTHLDISESAFNMNWLIDLLERGKGREIKYLRLSNPSIDDDLLEVMTKHCPNLEVLHLVDSKVTGWFVKGLVEALGSQLKRICLEGVEPKASFDAVKWAQEKGVTMIWRKNTYPGVCEA